MSAKSVEFEEVMQEEIPEVKDKLSLNSKVLDDLKVNLKIVAGEVEVSVADLHDLAVDQIVELEQGTEEPMKLFYDDCLIAEGNMVVVDNKLGVKITNTYYSS